MKTWIGVLIVTVVAAALGFALEAEGPLGKQIWPTAVTKDAAGADVEPEGANLALLMGMGVIEALAFGLGVAFLVFGYAWVKRTSHAPQGYAIAVWLAIAWGLVNWVPHTALHMNHGNINTAADYGGLVAIEYGFHFTLIIAAGLIAHFFVRALRTGAPMTKPTTTPTSGKTHAGPV